MLVLIHVTGTPTDEEDAAVPGTYAVEVDDDLPAADVPSAALDAFHESLPIGVLDDFTIAVRTPDGTDLIEREDAAGYQLGHRAHFAGRIV